MLNVTNSTKEGLEHQSPTLGGDHFLYKESKGESNVDIFKVLYFKVLYGMSPGRWPANILHNKKLNRRQNKFQEDEDLNLWKDASITRELEPMNCEV